MAETREIMAALRARYGPPACAFLANVGNATGFKCSGWCDGLSIGVWPSRGLALQGFEVKASRGDWLKELNDPAKAESFFTYCDFWWLVAGDAAIVRDGELPTTWGMMILKGGKLTTVVTAPKLDPKPPPRTFLAAMLRRVNEQGVDAAELKKSYDAGLKAGTEQAGRWRKCDKAGLDKLREKVETFEKASGVRIDEWKGAEKIGLAVKTVLDGDMPLDKLRRVLQWVRQVQESGESLLAEIDGAKAPLCVPAGGP